MSPLSVTNAVMDSAGVMSNAGLNTLTRAGATGQRPNLFGRSLWRLGEGERLPTARQSPVSFRPRGAAPSGEIACRLPGKGFLDSARNDRGTSGMTERLVSPGNDVLAEGLLALDLRWV